MWHLQHPRICQAASTTLICCLEMVIILALGGWDLNPPQHLQFCTESSETALERKHLSRNWRIILLENFSLTFSTETNTEINDLLLSKDEEITFFIEKKIA